MLDNDYLDALGVWDIVYSWGVLHHTGAMWQALANVSALVGQRGTLYIAIYNHQPTMTAAVWLRVKRAYNQLPKTIALAGAWACVDPSMGTKDIN